MPSSLPVFLLDFPCQRADLLSHKHRFQQIIFIFSEAFQIDRTDSQAKGKSCPFSPTLKLDVSADNENVGADVGLAPPLDKVIVPFLDLFQRRRFD